jgi:hypothetical protein
MGKIMEQTIALVLFFFLFLGIVLTIFILFLSLIRLMFYDNFSSSEQSKEEEEENKSDKKYVPKTSSNHYAKINPKENYRKPTHSDLAQSNLYSGFGVSHNGGSGYYSDYVGSYSSGCDSGSSSSVSGCDSGSSGGGCDSGGGGGGCD